ncbi:amidohydrolase family protein [Teichococcus wenyumeiae]|uniref:amidohydrolase family protein n=1 Tax=Teichococcus wenyumeiae TaxID=2478470 RepID=UPI0018F72B84|nr:amidohydrolase family protein [Pseudoroseomonas wenyumeiae]
MSIKTCKGPDPHTKTPAFKLPPGSVDAHCHVFGPAHKFPYAPDRSYTPPDAPVEDLRRVHSILGVDRAVIVQASCHGTDNTAMIDAIQHSEGAYRGVAIVDGSITDKGLEELDAGGVRGVRFNFVKHLGGTPDLEVFDRVLDRIQPLGWHVVLHLDAGDILEHEERIRRIKVPFVIDHMGRVQAKNGLEQEPFRRLLELMKNELAWVKICGPERVTSTGAPFHDAVPFARRLAEVAPDRTLWGTDFPHPNIAGDMPNDGDLVDILALAVEDEAARRKILIDNPDRLYWAR